MALPLQFFSFFKKKNSALRRGFALSEGDPIIQTRPFDRSIGLRFCFPQWTNGGECLPLFFDSRERKSK